MFRISSGLVKGKKLNTPKIEGIRISQEVVRQAIFAILEEKVKGADCLDLYAGSGVIGLEAISRGALWCTFVDENYEAIKAIQDNIKLCGFEEMTGVIHKDASKYIGATDKQYDIIFLDPFYNQTNFRHIFKTINFALKETGVVVFLHEKHLEIENYIKESGLVVWDERNYGATTVSYLLLETNKINN